MRVKIIRKKNENKTYKDDEQYTPSIDIREYTYDLILEDTEECWDFYLKKTKEESQRRMDTLNKYHNKLDKLRSEEERVKESIKALYNLKQQLETKVNNLKKGITQEQLFTYCNDILSVSKGKYNTKNKK